MTAPELEQLIHESLRGLPPEALAEVADFVLFLRKKTLDPAAFRDQLLAIGIRRDLSQLAQESQAHLEQEFADYEQRYPREP